MSLIQEWSDENPPWTNLCEQRKESTLIILDSGWPAGHSSIPLHNRRQLEKGLQDQHIFNVVWLIIFHMAFFVKWTMISTILQKSLTFIQILTESAFQANTPEPESALVTPSPFFPSPWLWHRKSQRCGDARSRCSQLPNSLLEGSTLSGWDFATSPDPLLLPPCMWFKCDPLFLTADPSGPPHAH